MTAEARAAERALAIGYAPARDRAALTALLALDDQLAAILRTTREPMVGQMRLTWWHDALSALAAGIAPPAHPVLAGLAAHVVPRGVSGATLAGQVDGWEALLDDPLDRAAIARFGAARGGGLFAAAATVLGARDALDDAGQGWALADLAAHLSDPEPRAIAAGLAETLLADAFSRRWSRAARPLGALALLARADLAGSPPGAPRRTLRLAAYRLTGR